MRDVTDQIYDALRRQLPAYDVRSVRRLGEGLDNVAYEVDDQLIVRVGKAPDPAARTAAARREAELLAVVRALSPLPVPEMVFVDAETGVHGYAKLSGTPLLHHPVAEPARLAPALGEFLSRVHQTPVGAVAQLAPPDPYPLSSWLADAVQEYQAIAGRLPARHRSSIEAFLSSPPPSEPDPAAAMFCHNDLGAEHILADAETSTITGVIDWSDAAVTDPARDLALLYRDLGPAVFERTLAHYRVPFSAADRERAVFYARCALVEDIAYGYRADARRYAEAGLAHLEWTFGAPTA
ncbi:MAG TPA: aminoglycoside phosphotransferase family protein [Jiangellaceae bacterium]|nr:aminoglycoside phosphotransferase family protein [Jiangellaceae bacterium]